jgi:hypothetical protein
MLRRSLAALLAAFNGLNGFTMLLDGAGWYARVPGVVETGPFNPHFVQDIGLAFIASALGLAAFAWKPSLWPAGVTGALFLVLHAILHLVGMASGHHEFAAFDLALVVLPAALALWAPWPNGNEKGQGGAHA